MFKAKNLICVFFLWLSGFFFYHALYGQRGYLALLSKRQQLTLLKEEDKKLSQTHDSLARKISLMREEIDPDLLEQQAWGQLRQLKAGRIVLFLPTER